MTWSEKGARPPKDGRYRVLVGGEIGDNYSNYVRGLWMRTGSKLSVGSDVASSYNQNDFRYWIEEKCARCTCSTEQFKLVGCGDQTCPLMAPKYGPDKVGMYQVHHVGGNKYFSWWEHGAFWSCNSIQEISYRERKLHKKANEAIVSWEWANWNPPVLNSENWSEGSPPHAGLYRTWEFTTHLPESALAYSYWSGSQWMHTSRDPETSWEKQHLKSGQTQTRKWQVDETIRKFIKGLTPAVQAACVRSTQSSGSSVPAKAVTERPKRSAAGTRRILKLLS